MLRSSLQLAFEKQLRFLDERGAQVVVEPRILSVGVRRQQPDVAHLQPLAEEVLHQRRARARIGQHAPHLLHRASSRRCSFPRIARSSSSSSGNAAPQEERQARRQLDVRRGGMARPASRSPGSASMRNRKSGLTSSRSSAERMPASKSAFGAPVLVETEQRLHVFLRRWPAVRAPRQGRENLRRASGFVALSAGRTLRGFG